MSDETMPPPNAEPRKRAKRQPSGEKVRYAARYAQLRQKVDTALRLLRKCNNPEVAAAPGLIAVAIEILEGE